MSISEKLASMSPRNRQYLLLGGVAAAILILSVMSASLMGDAAPPATETAGQQDLEPTNITTPGAAADPKEIWMEQSSVQMQQMNEVIKGLKDQMAAMESQKPDASATTESLLPPLPPIQPPKTQETSIPAPAPVAEPMP